MDNFNRELYKVNLLKIYFQRGSTKKLSNGELYVFKLQDPKGYEEMAKQAANELGFAL